MIQTVQRYEPGVKEAAQPIKILSSAGMCFAEEQFSFYGKKKSEKKTCSLILISQQGGGA